MMRRLLLVLLLAIVSCGKTASNGSTGGSNANVPSAGTNAVRSGAVPYPGGLVTPVVHARAIATKGSNGSSRKARPVTAALALSCARAGVDLQSLTVSNLKNGDVAGFSTQYSDSSNEMTNRSYKSGFGTGKANAAGVFEAQWKTPANAPPGKAVVLVIYSSGSSPLRPSFFVKAPTESC
ncbi:MAG: hypothetical protein ACYDCC_01445 [Actinomycetota bacterium]